MTLYEIDEQLNALVNEDGEIADFDAFEQLQMERDEKIENVGCWVKNLKAEAKMLADEIKALTDRKRAAENKAESLSKYLVYALNGQKFKSARVDIGYTHGTSIQIADNAEIPEDYIRYKEPEYDKVGLKNLLKSGVEVKGVTLVTSENIRIK